MRTHRGGAGARLRSRCAGATRCGAGDTTATGQRLRESVGALRCSTTRRREAIAVRRERAGARALERNDRRARRARGARASSLSSTAPASPGAARCMLAQPRGASTLTPRRRASRCCAASTEIGQGTTTMFAQIAADALGVPRSCVEVETPDTAQGARQRADGRVAHLHGRRRARSNGARAMRGARAWSAARRAAVARELREARARVLRRASACASRRSTSRRPASRGTTRRTGATPTACYGWAATSSTSRSTSTPFEVTRAQAAVPRSDVGKAIHPRARRRARSRAARCRGSAGRCSRSVVCKDGAMLNASSPTTSSRRRSTRRAIDVDRSSRCPIRTGPFGAKGVGELPMDGPAPAVADADRARGRRGSSATLPITPERIARACAARAAEPCAEARRRDRARRQRRERTCDVPAVEAPARRAARGLRPDRHEGRLRRRRVRRVHGPRRRRAGELAASMPVVPGRRPRDATVEALGTAGRAHPAAAARSSSAAARSAASARRACSWPPAALVARRLARRDPCGSALAGNLCRCTGYSAIYESIRHATRTGRSRRRQTPGRRSTPRTQRKNPDMSRELSKK